MLSPYKGLPSERFWKTGVEQQSPFSISNLYKKKFPLTGNIATAGSCFAQHIANHMRVKGYSVLDLEPPPPRMQTDTARRHGYLLYSARFGNVYLVRQLLQLAREAFGEFKPEFSIWEKDGRFYDALRPSVEPNGLNSEDEVRAHRLLHLKAVNEMLSKTDILVFTMGLTEGWIHKSSGTVYPTAPGTIAGEFDPEIFEFKNFRFNEIMKGFEDFMQLVQRFNPEIKFLLTISPVPLTATAENEHVLLATTYSKSTLRSVAGELSSKYSNIDYFPSFELIASHFSRGMFYSSNLRSVESAGVDSVMRIFFSEHQLENRSILKNEHNSIENDDVICEEALLDAFSE